MARVRIVIMSLQIADTAIIVLKLTLNEKIGLIGPRQIKIIPGRGVAMERDLEILAASLSNRYVIGVQSH